MQTNDFFKNLKEDIINSKSVEQLKVIHRRLKSFTKSIIISPLSNSKLKKSATKKYRFYSKLIDRKIKSLK